MWFVFTHMQTLSDKTNFVLFKHSSSSFMLHEHFYFISAEITGLNLNLLSTPLSLLHFDTTAYELIHKHKLRCHQKGSSPVYSWLTLSILGVYIVMYIHCFPPNLTSLSSSTLSSSPTFSSGPFYPPYKTVGRGYVFSLYEPHKFTLLSLPAIMRY